MDIRTVRNTTWFLSIILLINFYIIVQKDARDEFKRQEQCFSFLKKINSEIKVKYYGKVNNNKKNWSSYSSIDHEKLSRCYDYSYSFHVNKKKFFCRKHGFSTDKLKINYFELVKKNLSELFFLVVIILIYFFFKLYVYYFSRIDTVIQTQKNEYINPLLLKESQTEPALRKKESPVKLGWFEHLVTAILICFLALLFLTVLMSECSHSPRPHRKKKACISNMKTIEGACELYMMESGNLINNRISMKTLTAGGFLKSAPSCPSGGNYSMTIKANSKNGYDANNADITCSIHKGIDDYTAGL